MFSVPQFDAVKLHTNDNHFFIAVQENPRVVQLMSAPYKGDVVLNACPAQFGLDLSRGDVGVSIIHHIHKWLYCNILFGWVF